MKSKVYQVNDEEFKAIIARNDSYSACLRELGLGSKGGGAFKNIKARIAELHCSTEHFCAASTHGRVDGKPIPLEQILVQNSTYKNSTGLKQRLVNEGLLEYKCAICGITDWQNQPLVLQIDHINGEHTDNRLENLRLLCPNCHSQTNTYSGKNAIKYMNEITYCLECGTELKTKHSSELCPACAAKKRRKYTRPPREELKQLIRNESFMDIGKMLECGRQNVINWCKTYQLPHTKKEINAYSDEEWKNV